RDKRDERCTFLCSGDILHFLSLFKFVIMLFEGIKETRGARFHVQKIFHIFLFGRWILYIAQFSTVSFVLGLV
ncbi:hypothetical protein K443DRAFT_108115, partial [Laccaria amethystina LaAM-08-1]